jgi:hypothetical protein
MQIESFPSDAKARKLMRLMSDVEGDFAETMFGREDLPLLVRRLKFVERPLLAAKRTSRGGPLPPAKRGQNMRLGIKGKLDAL